MKITLTQPEIEQAVREFVGKGGITLANGAEMTVDFTAGRGENGLTATIDIPYLGAASLPVTPLTGGAVTANLAAPSLVTAQPTMSAPPGQIVPKAPSLMPAAPLPVVDDSADELPAEPAPVASKGTSLFANAASAE